MPSKTNKPCRAPGCPELLPVGTSYCERHQADAVRQYDNHYRDQRTKKYYNGPAWRKLRKLALAAHGGTCARCAAEGRTRSAAVVHHLDELSAQESLATSVDRLQPLCSECHEAIHQKWKR